MNEQFIKQVALFSSVPPHEVSLRLEDAEERTIRDLRENTIELSAACDRLRSAQEPLIERERLKLESELAGEIRQRLVPRVIPQSADFDFGARMVQADSVGGDFFDIIPLPGANAGIMIGDVADKGVRAALTMALTSNLVRAEAWRGGSAIETLRRVNDHLMEINDTEMSMTLLFGVLDGAARDFRYACAGHALPFVCNAEGEWGKLPYTSGIPLGSAREIVLDEQMLSMAPGNTLVFYTDGALTAMNASGAEKVRDRQRRWRLVTVKSA